MLESVVVRRPGPTLTDELARSEASAQVCARQPSEDGVGARAYEVMDRAFREHDLMVRITGDTVALTPPLIITEAQIDELADKLKRVISSVH